MAPRTGAEGTHGPSTLTDLLDGAWTLLREQAGPVLALTALCIGPGWLLGALSQRSVASEGFDLIGGGTLNFGANRFDSGAFLLSIGGTLLRTLGLLFLGAALTALVLEVRAGGAPSFGSAARAALHRSGPLLLAWPVLSAVSTVAYVACFLPLAVWLTYTAVVAPVVLAEDAGPIRAIGRSMRLVNRRFFPVLGVVLLSTLAESAISEILGLIPQAIAVALEGTAGWVVLSITTLVTSVVTTGPLVATAVLLYFDLRVRIEGLDLHERATVAFSGAR